MHDKHIQIITIVTIAYWNLLYICNILKSDRITTIQSAHLRFRYALLSKHRTSQVHPTYENN